MKIRIYFLLLLSLAVFPGILSAAGSKEDVFRVLNNVREGQEVANSRRILFWHQSPDLENIVQEYVSYGPDGPGQATAELVYIKLRSREHPYQMLVDFSQVGGERASIADELIRLRLLGLGFTNGNFMSSTEFGRLDEYHRGAVVKSVLDTTSSGKQNFKFGPTVTYRILVILAIGREQEFINYLEDYLRVERTNIFAQKAAARALMDIVFKKEKNPETLIDFLSSPYPYVERAAVETLRWEIFMRRAGWVGGDSFKFRNFSFSQREMMAKLLVSHTKEKGFLTSPAATAMQIASIAKAVEVNLMFGRDRPAEDSVASRKAVDIVLGYANSGWPLPSCVLVPVINVMKRARNNYRLFPLEEDMNPAE